MKRLVMAIALACVISSTAFAGIVHSTDAPAPQASSPAITIVLTILSLVR
jgi:hypothetical protein